VAGFDRSVDHLQQLGPHRFDVDRIPQARGESGDDRIRVVAGTVETTVDDALNPHAQRIEQGSRCQTGGGESDRRVEAEALVVNVMMPT